MAGTRDRSAVLHRLADLQRRDVVTVDSIPATSATRTLLDLGTCMDAAELRRVIDRARRLRLIHPHALVARFMSFGQQGRRGAAVLREVLTELDRDLALVESDLESMLLAIIVDAGLPTPVTQHEVHVDGRTYRLDAAYPEHRIAIEGDGFEFHSGREQFERDRSRQNDLMLAGWVVLRFSWRQIVREPEWVTGQIAAALRHRDEGLAQR
jgi:very-short-patch-repair endonuclease